MKNILKSSFKFLIESIVNKELQRDGQTEKHVEHVRQRVEQVGEEKRLEKYAKSRMFGYSIQTEIVKLSHCDYDWLNRERKLEKKINQIIEHNHLDCFVHCIFLFFFGFDSFVLRQFSFNTRF